MTDEQRQKQFKTGLRTQLRRLAGLHRSTADDVRKQLEQARKEIRAILAGAPSDYTQAVLTPLYSQIKTATYELGKNLGETGVSSVARGWELGQAVVDKPLARGGIVLEQVLPRLDAEVLFAQREFMIDRLADVSVELQRKIKSDLALHLIGAHDRSTVVSNLQSMLGSSRRRALTIVHTEVGRAHSFAAQKRMEQAREIVPGLKKQWRRSGKLYSRITHDAADGQIKEVDKPFLVGGEKLMHPRDAAGSAKNTINCGCVSLPFMDDWEVTNSGARAFTNEELLRQPLRRGLQNNLAKPAAAGAGIERIKALEIAAPEDAVRQIAEGLTSKEFKKFVARASFENDAWPVAVLPDDIVKALGTQARIVRLSSYTAAKQKISRKGQNFKISDYQLVQELVDKGIIIRQSEYSIRSIYNNWLLSLKTTQNKAESYTLSLHRIGDSGIRKVMRGSILKR